MIVYICVISLADDGSGDVDSTDATGDGNREILRNHKRGLSSDSGGKNALNIVKSGVCEHTLRVAAAFMMSPDNVVQQNSLAFSNFFLKKIWGTQVLFVGILILLF